MVQGIIKMLSEHWFWGGLTLIVLVWYSTITVYVAIRGAADIRTMLSRLGKAKKESADKTPPTVEPLNR